MNELTNYNTDGHLPKKNDHVLSNPPAFKENISDVKEYILGQLIKSVNHLGWKLPEDNDVKLLVNEIAGSIVRDYKQIRKAEIGIAFSKGIRGEYGEFMGLSVVTFEKFIIGYLASDYRAALGKSLPVAEMPAPTKELSREDRMEWAKTAYETFKEKGFYDDYGNQIYEFLDKEGLIPFTPSEKFELLDQARQEEYRRLQNPLSVKEAREFNKQIEALMTDNQKLLPRTKKLALNKYFQILLKSGSENIPFK